METEGLAIRFRTAAEYAFFFEDAHLLLLAWDRDDAKFLFRIHEQREGEVVLDYPGETFSSRVLDAVQTVFFIQVEESDGAPPAAYVLGSYFTVGEQVYGAYYERAGKTLDMVLFRLEGEGPDTELVALTGDEYEQVSQNFMERFQA